MPKQHVVSFIAEPHHLDFLDKVQKEEGLSDRSKAIRRILDTAIQNAMPYTITNTEGDIIYYSTKPFTTEEVYNTIKEQPEGIYIVNAPNWCFGTAKYEEEVMILADHTSDTTKKNLQELLDYQRE